MLFLTTDKNAKSCSVTRDEVNLAICHFARLKYQVPRTIARVNNPRDAWLFDDVFNVDVAVNQSAIMSHIIEEEMSMGDMMTLLKLRRGNYSLVTEKLPAGAKAVGMMLKDAGLPEHCVIAAIIRKGNFPGISCLTETVSLSPIGRPGTIRFI